MYQVVAGAGFEPHDLRVMSPTSYQAAPPCDMEQAYFLALWFNFSIYYSFCQTNMLALLKYFYFSFYDFCRN